MSGAKPEISERSRERLVYVDWVLEHLPDGIPTEAIEQSVEDRAFGWIVNREKLQISQYGTENGRVHVVTARDEQDLKRKVYDGVCGAIASIMGRRHQQEDEKRWRYVAKYDDARHLFLEKNPGAVYGDLYTGDKRVCEYKIVLDRQIRTAEEMEKAIEAYEAMLNRDFPDRHWAYDEGKSEFVEISDSQSGILNAMLAREAADGQKRKKLRFRDVLGWSAVFLGAVPLWAMIRMAFSGVSAGERTGFAAMLLTGCAWLAVGILLLRSGRKKSDAVKDAKRATAQPAAEAQPAEAPPPEKTRQSVVDAYAQRFPHAAWFAERLPEEVSAAMLDVVFRDFYYSAYVLDGLEARMFNVGDRWNPIGDVVFTARDEEELKCWAFRKISSDVAYWMCLPHREEEAKRWRYVPVREKSGGTAFRENPDCTYRTVYTEHKARYEYQLRLMKDVVPAEMLEKETERCERTLNAPYPDRHWAFNGETGEFEEISDSKWTNADGVTEP